MAKSVLDIVIKLTKAGGADKDTVRGLVGVKTAIMDAAAVAGTLVAAGYTIKKVFDETAGVFVAYADQVRSIQQATGLSAEESSKLIQVTDDLKISFEDLQKVIQKNGDAYDFSAEGLARMSEEYNSLSTAQEKAEFMQKRFGKSWINFVELMEQGGDRIRAAGDSVSDSLILDEENLRQAREYEKAVDNLGDSWHAVQVEIGGAVIPTLNQLLIAMQKNIDETDSFGDAGKGWLEFLYKGGVIGAVYRASVDAQKEATIAARDAVNAHADALDGVGVAAEGAAETVAASAEQISASNTALLGLVGTMQGAWASYDEQYQAINADMSLSDDERKAKLAELSATYDMESKKIILSLMQQQLAQDGLTTEEMNFLLQKGQAWGVYSGTVVSEAQKAMQQVELINQAINTIPSERTFTMQVLLKGGENIGGIGGPSFGSSGFTLPGRAEGGPVRMGEPYIVGENGPELFVPNASGTVVPNGGGQALGGVGGGQTVINVTYNPMFSSASKDEVIAAFIPMVEKAVRQSRGQGTL